MPCGWEGNRRSGVALAIRHRIQRFIHARTRSRHRRMGDELHTHNPHNPMRYGTPRLTAGLIGVQVCLINLLTYLELRSING